MVGDLSVGKFSISHTKNPTLNRMGSLGYEHKSLASREEPFHRSGGLVTENENLNVGAVDLRVGHLTRR